MVTYSILRSKKRIDFLQLLHGLQHILQSPFPSKVVLPGALDHQRPGSDQSGNIRYIKVEEKGEDEIAEAVGVETDKGILEAIEVAADSLCVKGPQAYKCKAKAFSHMGEAVAGG